MSEQTQDPEQVPEGTRERGADDRRGVVVVGAGMAGVQTAVALREQGFTGPVTLIGAEPHQPYDRPPLSKAVLLGTAEGSAFDVDFEALGITLRLGCEALGVRPGEHVLDTSAGPLPYDFLVLATGAEPMRLPGAEGVPGSTCCAPWTTPNGCARCSPGSTTSWSSARAGSAPSSPPPRGRRAAR